MFSSKNGRSPLIHEVDRLLLSPDVMHARGFTLVETLVAISITGVALTALAQLFIMATEANADARRTTFASILATEKIEQLRSLGGDLAQQGNASLSADIAGACDFLDEYGRSRRVQARCRGPFTFAVGLLSPYRPIRTHSFCRRLFFRVCGEGQSIQPLPTRTLSVAPRLSRSKRGEPDDS